MTREEILQAFDDINFVYNDCTKYDTLKRMLEELTERKHGEWIKDRLCSTSGGTYGVRRCSVCEHYFQDLVNEYNFCPNCGADMRGEQNG